MCTLSINNQLNGIELVFESKPAQEILTAIKAAGFRWHNLKKLWYAKQTPERMELAQKLSGGNATETAPAVPVAREAVSKYGIKVGDVFCDSWGYEQTNVEFYKVTKIISACKVEIVELGHTHVETYGPMSGTVVPNMDRPIGEPIQKMVSQSSWEKHDGTYHIKINSCVTLTPWSGSPMHESSYY